MEKRSRRRTRDLVTQPASQGLSENEIGCARISMMARSTNAPCKGRIQMRKTNPLHLLTFGLQRTAGPYRGVRNAVISPLSRAGFGHRPSLRIAAELPGAIVLDGRFTAALGKTGRTCLQLLSPAMRCRERSPLSNSYEHRTLTLRLVRWMRPTCSFSLLAALRDVFDKNLGLPIRPPRKNGSLSTSGPLASPFSGIGKPAGCVELRRRALR